MANLGFADNRQPINDFFIILHAALRISKPESPLPSCLNFFDFQLQKAAGGIIDIEAESKKFLIVTSQAASGGDEGQSGGWQAASATRQEPPTAGVQKAAAQPAAAAAELSKKHKGGSGMHKKRDYGERKRATRRRN